MSPRDPHADIIPAGAPPEPTMEAPPLQTRAPAEGDLDALVAIDAAWAGHERRNYLASRLARALRPSGISLARVAEAGGEVVGFLLGEVTRGEFGRVEPEAWIDTFGVRPDCVRRGVGKALLEDFERHAQVLGTERVRTLLDPKDLALTGFLEKQGFRLATTKVVERQLSGGLS